MKRKPAKRTRTTRADPFIEALAKAIDPLRPPGSPPIEEVVHQTRFERYYPIPGEQNVTTTREVLWRRPK